MGRVTPARIAHAVCFAVAMLIAYGLLYLEHAKNGGDPVYQLAIGSMVLGYLFTILTLPEKDEEI